MSTTFVGNARNSVCTNLTAKCIPLKMHQNQMRLVHIALWMMQFIKESEA